MRSRQFTRVFLGQGFKEKSRHIHHMRAYVCERVMCAERDIGGVEGGFHAGGVDGCYSCAGGEEGGEEEGEKEGDETNAGVVVQGELGVETFGAYYM